ncbi:MAG: aminotransferase [Gemmatales bacterium]|nr:MAG: aminotransferase [Gemmatales bacterium]
MTGSRRDFLRGATAAAAALPPVASWLAANASTPIRDESFWRKIRQAFIFDERKVPMNAANLCPSPRSVFERVMSLTRDIDADCSFQNREKFAKYRDESRASVAGYLGASTDEIALVRNTSEANNVIVQGVALKPGDEVVVWDQNHPTNHVAWSVRAARIGFSVKRVRTPTAPASEDELIDVFVKALGPKTRVLALTHVSNVSGIQLPIKEICRQAHKRDIFVHVDGAQTCGALRVDLHDLDCDSYSASAHKWLVGPKEVGILYIRESRIDKVWPLIVGSGWGEKVQPASRGARKFETLGQRNDAALAALAMAIEFHNRIGPDLIETRIYELVAALKASCKELGLDLVTPFAPQLSAGVCTIQAPPARRRQLFERMYNEFGIAAAPTGGLRFCPHLYNTMEHIERVVRGLKAMRKLFEG